MYCGVIMSRNLIDIEAAVELRIVDQALPADGGARLLEVHAHDDEQVVGQTGALGIELRRIVARRLDVMDRARPGDDQQAVVGAVQNAMNGLARGIGGISSLVGQRKLAQHFSRARQFLDFEYSQIVGLLHGQSVRQALNASKISRL
jgi:hypothetical protein